MASQFKVKDGAWGTLQIYAIYEQEDGTWEREWECLRTIEQVAGLLSRISWEAYQDLRLQYTQPFRQEVGLEGSACLIKVGEPYSLCYIRESCPTYNSQKCVVGKNPPLCYDANAGDEEVRNALNRLYDLWRFGFYVILVEPALQ